MTANISSKYFICAYFHISSEAAMGCYPHKVSGIGAHQQRAQLDENEFVEGVVRQPRSGRGNQLGTTSPDGMKNKSRPGGTTERQNQKRWRATAVQDAGALSCDFRRARTTQNGSGPNWKSRNERLPKQFSMSFQIRVPSNALNRSGQILGTRRRTYCISPTRPNLCIPPSRPIHKYCWFGFFVDDGGQLR